MNPAIFAGKPIIRGRRLAVEHVLGTLAAGDMPDTILAGYSWLAESGACRRRKALMRLFGGTIAKYRKYTVDPISPSGLFLGREPLPAMF